MKQSLTQSLPAKITAIFLAAILFVLATVGGVAAGFLISVGAYEGGYDIARRNTARNLLYDHFEEVAENYYNQVDIAELYRDASFYYTIKDAEGNVLASNYNGEPTLGSAQAIERVGHTETIIAQTGKYAYAPAATYDVTLWCKAEPEEGNIVIALRWLEIGYNLRYTAAVVCIIATIALLAVMIFLYCSAGHRKNTDEVILNKVDKLPFDVYTLLFVVVGFIEGSLISAFNDMEAILFFAVLLPVDFLLLLGYTMSIATRVKTGTFINNMLISRLLVLIFRGIARGAKAVALAVRSIPMVRKTALAAGAVTLINLFIALTVSDVIVFFIWIAETIVLVPAVLLTASAFRRLQKGAEAIADGNLTFQVDTRSMPRDFRDFAGSLNNISEGMSKTVEERMKSEHFKTELITNVSHDIKTPLTSIINYVDLIKKEEPENGNIREYIGVLDRQSTRLKKLIEDLVEASKASTGNLAVNLAPCEVGVLLTQTAGEYQEKAEKAELELIVSQPEEPVKILADGRHLWRIFDNLMNNVCKYAQPKTRVYLDLKAEGGRAQISLRNISKYPLNISSEELMERFVRGDSSRNTEGSGLGLSIAQSLAELQNGRLDITVDGDLFKAVLTFELFK